MVQNINSLNGVDKNYKTNDENQLFHEFTYITKAKEDSFEKKKVDKSNNGKFDIIEAGKNYIKGVLSPITAIIKHPIITISMLGITAAACSLIPVLSPILGISFGALSVFQLGKGCYDAAKNIKNKEYDEAEKSFTTVGQGMVGTILSALGLKQTARIAKEAKLMNELKVNSLSSAQKEAIAKEVSNGSYLNALKENISLFTTKTGLKALINQFKPSNIFQRGKDIINHFFKKKEITKIKKEKMKFKDTIEGKRRAAMTSEEIEAQVNSLYEEACNENGIPKGLRPKLEIYSDKTHPQFAGEYVSNIHTIRINETAYKEGHIELPDVIKHELTHAQQAIYRQRLSMPDKEKFIVEYLLDRIQNGDKENLLTGEKSPIIGSIKVKPPKMNAQMKSDFSKLAQEKLYQLTDYSTDDIMEMVEPLVMRNPEFIKRYNCLDDALTAMANYAKNQNFRYKLAINNASGFNTSNVDTTLLKELTEEEKIAALKSFIDGMDCIESNFAREGGVLGLNSDFNQYQFSPEEVLAQQQGKQFEISKLEAKLNKLRSQDNYDLAEEARLLDLIKKAKLTIEYKTKGLEMYRLKTEAFNHPENTQLASQVKILQDELSVLQEELKAFQGTLSFTDIQELYKQGKTQAEIMDIAKNFPATEYKTYQEFEKYPLGASIVIPPATTTVTDILSDDLKKS